MPQHLGEDVPPFPLDSSWSARVYRDPEAADWLGGAVLIDETRLLTCNHVAPSGQLWVEFPMAEENDGRRYRVEEVTRADDRYDLALLTLAAPPGVTPAPLRHTPPVGLVNDPWWTFGYPHGETYGNDAQGTVGSALAHGFVRLDCRPGDRYVLKPGFSGSGVWSPQYQAVVAIVVEAGLQSGDGKAVTLHRAISCFPDAKLDRLTAWTAEAADQTARASWGLGSAATGTSTGWNLHDDPETTRHWSPRARGVSIDSERGHRFKGRRRALSEIARWLDAPTLDHRVLVVTGSPGVGKSAVLGRIVTTADPLLRRQLPASDSGVRASSGSVQCALHAKGKTALEVAAEIARAASVPLPERLEDLAPAVRAELKERPRRFAIIIDALDEATSPADARHIVTDLVLPLAQTCADVGVRLVIGTRRHDDSGDLLDTIGVARTVIDLNDPGYFELDDLTAYALATLRLQGAERTGNPYDDLRVARPVAVRIAELSDRNFLVTGLVARSHGLYDDTAVAPADLTFSGRVDQALNAYLDLIPPVGGATASDLLTALAYARAPGLPFDLWRMAVRALSGIEVSESQLLRFARSSVANFLVESTHGRAYRLFHQALNDVLLTSRRQKTVSLARDQADLARVFQSHGRDRGWDSAPEYLLRNLPGHAAAGHVLDGLLDDADFLVHADLTRVLAVQQHATSEDARVRIRLLELTPHAQSASPSERLAMLAVTQSMESLAGPFVRLALSREVPYRPRWSSCRPRQETARLEGRIGSVTAICAFPTSDGPRLATTGPYGALQIWDPTTISLVHGHYSRSYGTNAICAFTGSDGRTRFAIGDGDAVRITNSDTSEPTPNRLRAGRCTAICAFTTQEGPCLAIGSNYDGVAIWNPETGELTGNLDADTGPVTAICAFTTEEGPCLAIGSNYDGVAIWNPETSELTRTLNGDTGPVTAICAFTTLDGRTRLAIATGPDEIEIRNPDSGASLQTLHGHTGRVTAICSFTGPDGPRLASSSDDGTVRIWDPDKSVPLRTLQGHTRPVIAICAFTTPDNRTRLATGSDDGTVRIWDPDSRVFTSDTGYADAHLAQGVTALCTFIGPDGPRLTACTDESVLQIWNPDNGESVITLDDYSGSGEAICAFSSPRGPRLATSDGTILQIWDPDGSEPVRTGRVREEDDASIIETYEDPLDRLDDDSAWGSEDPSTWMSEEDTDWVTAICAFPTPLGPRLATSNGGALHIWNPDMSEPIGTYYSRTRQLHSICSFTGPDGQTHLATGGDYGTVEIWSPGTNGPVRNLVGREGASVNAICSFTAPDGRVRLATGGDGGALRIWNPHHTNPTHTFYGSSDSMNTICSFTTPENRVLIATGNEDSGVTIWDLHGLVMEIPMHHAVRSVAMCPNGLAIGLEAGVIVLELRL